MPRTATDKTIVPRKTGVALKRLTVYLEPRLAERLAHRAIREGRSQSDIIGETVAAYLKGPAK